MLLLLLVACGDPNAPPRTLTESVGTVSDNAVVWGGFSQVWGYNHRVNSLGDHVGPLVCDDGGCAAVVTHAAASGAGSDTASWASRYTSVVAPGVSFLGGSTLLAIDAEEAEGELIAFSTEVILPEAPVGEELHALLNGFDLQATGDADKLEHFALAIGEPEVEADHVRVPIDVAIELDCDSVECDLPFQADTSVHYELLVSWLLVAGDTATLAVTPVTERADYAWRNTWIDDEIQLRDMTRSTSVQGREGLGSGILGVRGFAVDLDDEHHMAEWATIVEPGRYEPSTGTLAFDATIAFKQWNAGTWWNPVSYTSPGAGAIDLDLALVQLRDACTRSGEVGGTITWVADNGPASSAAVDTREVVPGGCE